MSEAIKRAARRLGLEAEFLRRQQQFGAAKCATVFGEFMDKLFRRGGDVVEARQHDQAGEAAIYGLGTVSSLIFRYSHSFAPSSGLARCRSPLRVANLQDDLVICEEVVVAG